MSKLADQINATITDSRTPIINSCMNFKLNVEQHNPLGGYPCAYKVKFRAVFGKEIYIDESHAHKDSEVLKLALKEIKHSVVEEVFGEFKLPIIELRMALYNRDIEKAQEQLRTIEKQMFNV